MSGLQDPASISVPKIGIERHPTTVAADIPSIGNDGRVLHWSVVSRVLFSLSLRINNPCCRFAIYSG